MTKRSTRFAIYTILALKGLMWYDAPFAPATAVAADGATASAAVASVPNPSAPSDALAVKCREGAKEYHGPRYGLGGQALLLRGMRYV